MNTELDDYLTSEDDAKWDFESVSDTIIDTFKEKHWHTIIDRDVLEQLMKAKKFEDIEILCNISSELFPFVKQKILKYSNLICLEKNHNSPYKKFYEIIDIIIDISNLIYEVESDEEIDTFFEKNESLISDNIKHICMRYID